VKADAQAMFDRPVLKAVGRHLFVPTVLVGSFLLFLVQPMVARMALPRLGGAPAVWNSAMLVYQALLLAGYAYAHVIGRLRPRVQAGIHVAVLLFASLWLPIHLIASQPPADASPVVWTPWLLVLSIGPLFFAVSAGAPLVQRWCALASDGEDPYALYAASNLGSFGGLLAYPLLVEPNMALAAQSRMWSAGFLLLVVLVAGCALRLPRGSAASDARPTSSAPSSALVLRWTILALVPSGLMLATSTYITTDIVAIPLLWVMPLGLYLLSWTVAFAERRAAADLLTRIAPITILLFGGIIVGGYQKHAFLSAFVALALLFMTSVALHTALYRSRPSPDRLTGFYLATALGGALGGVTAGLVAPVIFDWNYEYPLLILAAGLLVPQMYLTGRLRGFWLSRTTRPLLFGAVVVAIAIVVGLRIGSPDPAGRGSGVAFLLIASAGLATLGARLPYAALLATALLAFGGWQALALSWRGDARIRSYFGVYTIRSSDRVHELDHGTTLHGIQLRGSVARERTPTTYYAPGSGVGLAMSLVPPLYGQGASVGVVGLGTGTLACYAQPNQRWRFFEIDPAVIRIARQPGKFSYLSRCAPDATISLGDARLRLAREPSGSFDLLALDAFSSDTVPMHLLTREAFAGYARVLRPSGLLLVHVSNRFLDLTPVVAAAAEAGGWHAMQLDYRPGTLERVENAASGSWWIAMSRDEGSMDRLLLSSPDWKPLASRPGLGAWTDDYASILPLIRLGR
jgi:SAM-dependent methyltransferase